MNRKYDAVIFDLDGTLLDTLSDLTNSVNTVMKRHHMPQYTREQIRSFVGNGIRRLMQQVVPGGEAHPDFISIYEEFCAYYNLHCLDETEPYPGIISLLDGLNKGGYRTAIVSNKADFAVKKLRNIYFKDLVEVAIGERPDVRKKPAPDTVFQALRELDVERFKAVYVGDSEVDVQTAENAGMDSIIVTWGFRDRELLLQQGARSESMAANVNEVYRLIKKN